MKGCWVARGSGWSKRNEKSWSFKKKPTNSFPSRLNEKANKGSRLLLILQKGKRLLLMLLSVPLTYKRRKSIPTGKVHTHAHIDKYTQTSPLLTHTTPTHPYTYASTQPHSHIHATLPTHARTRTHIQLHRHHSGHTHSSTHDPRPKNKATNIHKHALKALPHT